MVFKNLLRPSLCLCASVVNAPGVWVGSYIFSIRNNFPVFGNAFGSGPVVMKAP